jgi:Spy/CpxP family protein refolding chaperone
MRRVCVLLVGLAAVVLLIGEGQSGDKATQPKSKLPLFFDQLNLTKAQVNGIKTIQANYVQMIEDLKKKEEKEILNVLTPEQKTRLRQLIADKLRGGNTKDKKGG